ncbi:MAG: hypothetical protein KatS3mg102_0638 [Planctomycetota bacterium]|nr:MAG: hypothetical protein KatS3mg102_0638 [Planctomycetota bacterium]
MRARSIRWAAAWFVEALTDEVEAQAEAYFRRIEELGGVVPAIEAGFFQKEIGDAAYRLQQEYERGERHIVGVTRYVEEDEEIPILVIDPAKEQAQRQALARLRASRDQARVEEALRRVQAAAREGDNLMPALIDAALAYATLGETVAALKAVFGVYSEPVIL